jgi:hypothetical protein
MSRSDFLKRASSSGAGISHKDRDVISKRKSSIVNRSDWVTKKSLLLYISVIKLTHS